MTTFKRFFFVAFAAPLVWGGQDSIEFQFKNSACSLTLNVDTSQNANVVEYLKKIENQEKLYILIRRMSVPCLNEEETGHTAAVGATGIAPAAATIQERARPLGSFLNFAEGVARSSSKQITCNAESGQKQRIGTYELFPSQNIEKNGETICKAIGKRNNFLRTVIEHLVLGQPVKVPVFPDETDPQMVEMFIKFPGEDKSSFFPSYEENMRKKSGTVIRGSGGPSQWTLYGIDNAGTDVSIALMRGEKKEKLFSDFIYLNPKSFYARLSEYKNAGDYVAHTGDIVINSSKDGAAWVYKVSCYDFVDNTAVLMGEYIEGIGVSFTNPALGLTFSGEGSEEKCPAGQVREKEACKIARGLCSQLVSFSIDLNEWSIPTKPGLSSSPTIFQTGFEKIEFSFVKENRFIMPFIYLDPPSDLFVPSEGDKGENKFLKLIGGSDKVKCILTLYHLDGDELKKESIESVRQQFYAVDEALACLKDSTADKEDFKTKIDAVVIDRSEQYSAISCIEDGKVLAKFFNSPGTLEEGEELYDLIKKLHNSAVKPEKIIIPTSNSGGNEKEAINQCKRMIAIRSKLNDIVGKGSGKSAIAGSKKITENFAFGKKTNEKEDFPIRAIGNKEPAGDMFRITKMNGMKFCELSLFVFIAAEKDLGETVRMYAPPCGSDEPVPIKDVEAAEKIARLIVVSDYDSKSGEYFSMELFNALGQLDMVYSAWILDEDNTIFEIEGNNVKETNEAKEIIVDNKMEEIAFKIDKRKLSKLVEKLYSRLNALKMALSRSHTREEKAANIDPGSIQPMVLHRGSSDPVGKLKVLLPHSPPKDGPTMHVDGPKKGGKTLLAISDSRCTLQFAGLPEMEGLPINEVESRLVAGEGIKPCFGAAIMTINTDMGGIYEERAEGKYVNVFCPFDFGTVKAEKIKASALFTFRNDDSSIFRDSHSKLADRFSDLDDGLKADIANKMCVHMKILISETANLFVDGPSGSSSNTRIFNDFRVSISSGKEIPLISTSAIFENTFFVSLPFPTMKKGGAITLQREGKILLKYYGYAFGRGWDKIAFISALRDYWKKENWFVDIIRNEQDLKSWPTLAVENDENGRSVKRYLLDTHGRVVLEQENDGAGIATSTGFRFETQKRLDVEQPQCLLLVNVEGDDFSASYSKMVSTVLALRSALAGGSPISTPKDANTAQADAAQNKDFLFDVVLIGEKKRYDYSVIQKTKDWRKSGNDLIVEFPPMIENKPLECQIQLVVLAKKEKGVVQFSADALAEMNYEVSRNAIYSDFTCDNGCIDLNKLRQSVFEEKKDVRTYLVWDEGRKSSRITVSCVSGDKKFGEYVTEFSDMEISKIPGFQFWEKEYLEIMPSSEVGATSSERFAFIGNDAIFTKTCQQIWKLKKLFEDAYRTVVHGETSEREEDIRPPTVLLESVYALGSERTEVTESEIKKFIPVEASSQKRYYVGYSWNCGIWFYGERFEKLEEKVVNFFKSRIENICDPNNKFASKPSEWFGRDEHMWVRVRGSDNNRKISFSRFLDSGSGDRMKIWEVVRMMADDVSILFEEGSTTAFSPRGTKTVGTFNGKKLSEKWIEEKIIGHVNLVVLGQRL